MPPRILDVAEDPAGALLVARWLVAGFTYPGGPRLQALAGFVHTAHLRPPQRHFVVFDGPRPVGTGSIIQEDLESRPDLTPWLAGLYIEPDCRGRGLASALVRHLEAAARDAGVATLWLYTWTAAALYERLGWQHAGPAREPRRDIDVALMRRDLSGPSR